MHFCLLLGYGAGASTRTSRSRRCASMVRERRAQGRRRRRGGRELPSRRSTRACSRSMSKMGISTLQSYRGAQIFEAIGLNRERRSTATSPGRASRIEGVGLDVIAREAQRAARPRVRGVARRSTASSTSAASTSGGGAASTTCTTRTRSRKLQHAVRAGQLQDVQGVHARSSNDESRAAVHAARPAAVQARRRRSRSTRSSRPARSSSASRPARCRSARSAARRTRTSRSR